MQDGGVHAHCRSGSRMQNFLARSGDSGSDARSSAGTPRLALATCASGGRTRSRQDRRRTDIWPMSSSLRRSRVRHPTKQQRQLRSPPPILRRATPAGALPPFPDSGSREVPQSDIGAAAQPGCPELPIRLVNLQEAFRITHTCRRAVSGVLFRAQSVRLRAR